MNYFRWAEHVFLLLLALGAAAAVVGIVRWTHLLIAAAQQARVDPAYALARDQVRMVTTGAHVRQELLRELSRVRSGDTVRIAVFRWTDDDLARACIRAHQVGADVQIISDAQAPGTTGSCIRRLARAGIPVWLYSAPVDEQGKAALMHHKYIAIRRPAPDTCVTDAGVGDRCMVATGSYNFTRSAARKNCENMVFMTSPEVYYTLVAAWDELRVACGPLAT